MSWEAWGTNEPPELRDCRYCNGTGKIENETCTVCEGEGECPTDDDTPIFFD
jgi:DnaJ-class molecular chaperone